MEIYSQTKMEIFDKMRQTSMEEYIQIARQYYSNIVEGL